MTTIALYIYFVGVAIAFALLMHAVRRESEKQLFVFVPNERVQFLSLLSWVVVAGFAAAWLLDAAAHLYAYVLFKYLLWKNRNQNNRHNEQEN